MFADRRARLAERMGPDSVLLLVAPAESVRSNDSHYKYRPSSDIVYVTGFAEPECAIVFRPGAEKKLTMFVRKKDPEMETWEGRRSGPEGAVRDFGADEAFPIEELDAKLPGLLANAQDLHYFFGANPAFDARLGKLLVEMRARERRTGRPPRRIVDPTWTLHEQRLFKSPDEVALLERAAAITAEAHVAAMKASRPGATEREIEALIDFTFRHRGAVGPGYDTIVGAGANATILHYVDARSTMQAGDLVLVDAGAEVDWYTADVTRTFPCGGKFSPAQRRVYETVLRVQEEMVRFVRPGVSQEEIHTRTVELLVEGMIELGLLAGPVNDRIADGSFKRFYMHRTSHWLGLDVHDVGTQLTADGKHRGLEPGMVITIEPGLYVGANDAGAPAEYRGIGVRIEDDVLVTMDAGRNLTHATPKQVAELEELCS